MFNDKEIRDDEMRVIGRPDPVKPSPQKSEGCKKILPLALLCSAVLLLIVGGIFLSRRNGVTEPQDVEGDFFESILEGEKDTVAAVSLKEPLGDYSDSVKAYTEHIVRIVNDIEMDIYIPHNACPRLFVGTPGLQDKNVVFTTQAADIRADNGRITGAFVNAGEPLAWGLSKKGFCAIIDGKFTIGRSENSPLFEEATEKGGYFFRQYPLVDNGVMVENESKGKSVRKAICQRGEEIFVVMTKSQESFHDFSQALVDLGVDNAVYLVGSVSYGYFRDRYDHLAIIYNKLRGGYKYENHIQWVVNEKA